MSPEYAADLLRRQCALQAEVPSILEELDIVKLLRPHGTPLQMGSSSLGLMVWPDIDMCVSCPGLAIEHALETMRPIYSHPMVKRVQYLNEVGQFNSSGEVHDRYYFAIYYHGANDIEWKIDISFWNAVEDHPEPVQDAVAKNLTEETRLAILWIKDIWHRLPTYQTEVFSVDIYDAVLEHGVRTPSEFDEYLAGLGKTNR
jgi:hypothetical protein